MIYQQPKPFCIGIIGGMGPRATVRFEMKLLERLQGSDQDLPDIICMNFGRTPDRTAYLQGEGINPGPSIRNIALQLEQLGASVLCIPCNTAHAPHILRHIIPRLSVPLLHMPELTIKKIRSLNLQRAVVLSTEGTRMSGIFNCEYTVRSPDRTQELLSKIISDIKAGITPSGIDIKNITRATRQLGADSVILACTELSEIAHQFNDITVIDTLDVLADACVQYYERSNSCQTNQKVLVPTNIR